MPRLFCCAFLTAVVVASLDVSGQSPRLLPGTLSDAFARIGGCALDSVGALLRDATIRLRDARLGRSMEILRTDRDGHLSFRPVDPGSYVVEVVTENQTAVLAASQVINIEGGQVASVTIKLPFEASGLAYMFGNSPSRASAVA
jgi:hypothetical protein